MYVEEAAVKEKQFLKLKETAYLITLMQIVIARFQMLSSLR